MSETPSALDDLMTSLAPLAKAMSVPGVGHVDPAAVVQLRPIGDPMQTWQCGGFTTAHLHQIALCYHALKSERATQQERLAKDTRP